MRFSTAAFLLIAATTTSFVTAEDSVSLFGKTESCTCEAGDDRDMSWKCGTYVYICPDVRRICSVQAGSNVQYYPVDQETCDEMKSLEIGDKCPYLPDEGMENHNSLSNRVCYDDNANGDKTDSGGCSQCKDSFPNPYTEAPSASPSASPSESPSASPSASPSSSPSAAPSSSPSSTPSAAPSSSPSSTPSAAPSSSPSVSPSAVPTTKAPTMKPTENPTVAPVPVPSLPPVEEAETVPPVDVPTNPPTSAPVQKQCECGVDHESNQSFKCGNDIYLCPGVSEESICSTQESKNPDFYPITQEQCDAMKEVELGEKCVSLPQFDLSDPKGLSNRVCYLDGGEAWKIDGDSCDQCQAPPSPTTGPVDSPTVAPVAATTDAPVAIPAEPEPTPNPTHEPTPASCSCEPNDETSGSFKCGNDVYVCPGIEEICGTQSSKNSVYYPITHEQCEMMQTIKIGEKCIKLPQHELTHPKGLSNRVCYGDGKDENGTKVDSGSCDACKDTFTLPWAQRRSLRGFMN